MIHDLKTTVREHPERSVVSEPDAPRRLLSQWYKDADNALVIRWIIEGVSNAPPLPDTLAA